MKSVIAKLTELLQERSRHEAAIREIDESLGRAFGVRRATNTETKKNSAQRTVKRRAHRGTVSNAIVSVLAEAKHPLDKQELAKRVLNSPAASTFGIRLSERRIIGSAYQLSRKSEVTGVTVEKSHFQFNKPAPAVAVTTPAAK